MSDVLWARGRKKVVSRFTAGEGLWMLAVISVLASFVASLFLLGYLRVD
jgi:hypothetical protein